MSTVIHADGIKTVIHTSQFQDKFRLNFLSRCGMSSDRVRSIARDWRLQEEQAHIEEHSRVLEMVRFLREDCANPEMAEMYRQEYLA